MPNSPNSPERHMPLLLVKLAGVMFVTVTAALVALVLADQDTESVERLAGPLLTAVIITGVLGSATRTTNERLTQIERKAAEGECGYTPAHGVTTTRGEPCRACRDDTPADPGDLGPPS